MKRGKLHLVFGSISLAAFVVATVGIDTVARVVVSNEAVVEALMLSIKRLMSPWLTFFLLWPFVFVGVLGAELGNSVNIRSGVVFFGVLLGSLSLVYMTGYWDSQVALREGLWTASTLAVGSTTVLGYLLVFAGGAIAGIIGWRYRKRET